MEDCKSSNCGERRFHERWDRNQEVATALKELTLEMIKEYCELNLDDYEKLEEIRKNIDLIGRL